LALGQPKKPGGAASPDAVDAGTMPPKRVVDTARTGAERGKGAAELAAERVALQEEKGEESSDDEFLMPGERRLKNRLKLEVPRQSWQMEVLEANRLGDVERLRVAFKRPGANVNLRTAEGAYGGFRYATWGTHSSYLGGNPSGESLLMLAARPDNAQYPNRREVLTMLIEEFDAERNYRNGNEKTARDLNPLLMDEVHPLKRWTVEDAHSWAESAGLKVKIEHTYDWLKIFDAYQLDGRGLVDIWTKQKFEDYVDERLADLTRVGVNTDAIEEETPRWIYCLEQLKLDAKNAQKTKRRREAAARAEAERRQAIRDEQRRAKLRGKLDKGAAHVLKHAKSLGAFGSMGSLAAAKREAAEKKRREEERAAALARISGLSEAEAEGPAPAPAPASFLPPVKDALPAEATPPKPPLADEAAAAGE